MAANFKLDRKGGSEVLKVTARSAIDELTRRVGDAAGEEAITQAYTTDRAAGLVSVPAAQQAKDGRLTRAASQAGLEVRTK